MGEWKKVLVSGSDIEVRQITASGLSEASKPHIVLYDTGSGALHYTSSDAMGGTGGTIGTPTDSTYTDGFFDNFTDSTTIADAIDEISEAFLDLAPAKAGVLTLTNLVKTNPSTFSGYLAGGLTSAHWYVGAAAYDEITTLTSATTVDLDTTDTSTRFRAGKYSDLSPTNVLIGGVTSSITYGNATSPTTEDSRALTSGVGSTGTIQIENLTQYNTFWVKANARINHTLSSTGSYKYTISADNGAGETNETQLFYVGNTTHYPNQSVNIDSVSTANATYNYLSGVRYLKTATFTINITGTNLYNPVYSANQVQFSSDYFSNISSGSSSPNWNDILDLTITRTLLADKNSGISLPDMTLTGYKPGKSNVTDTANLNSLYRVNSYSTTQDSNGNNAEIKFLDEDYRVNNLQAGSWNSTAALTDGNLQVQNGRLIVGEYGDSGSLTQGGTGGDIADFFSGTVGSCCFGSYIKGVNK